MKPNDNLKRPISSKPSKTRPSTSKPSVIKTEETQIETINKQKRTNPNFSEEKINESEEDISRSYIINKSKSTIEKLEFLDSLAKGSRKDSFINLLDDEAQRIDKINERKQKLYYITLKENNIDGLYEWKTLFNNSRPMSHYTRINYKEPVVAKEIISEDIKSPKILVDLPDDKMMYFFGKNAFGNNTNNKSTFNFLKKLNNYNISNTLSNNDKTETLKSNRSYTKFRASSKIKSSRTNKTGKNPYKIEKGHNYIKPISIYSKFNPEDTFYFSNAFSDYYKEDLKTFTKKMPILKAKVKTNSNKLKKIIKNQRAKSSQKEKKLNNLLMKDSLNVKKQDLIISAERRNPVPLMKSIYKQSNPEAIEIKENIRKYFNTMKPFGNDDGKTDYTKNDRWRLNRELIKLRKGHYIEENKNNYYGGKSKKLILSYYNINDPEVQIFRNLTKNNEDIMNYSYEIKNEYENIDNFNLEEKNKSKSIEKKEEAEEKKNNKDIKALNIKEEEKIENIRSLKIKSRPRTGFKQSKEINILKNEKLKKSISSNRPHSSNLRRNNLQTEINYFDLEDYNEIYKNYIPSNRFPVKKGSQVKNPSYNKINEMLKERKLQKKKSSYIFMTQSGKIKETFLNNNINNLDKNKKIRPRTADGIRSKTELNMNYKISQLENTKNHSDYNYICYNKFIKTVPDLNIEDNRQFRGFFSPINCFNKLAGKYYSSSINVHVKNKRQKRKEILDFYEKYNRDMIRKL